MQLPDPIAFPGILDRYGITAPAQRSLLWAASTLYQDLQGVSRHPENRDMWQTAEALWLAAGLLPPVFEWPWPSLERVVGAVSPGEVWVIGARTGDGKSTVVANLIRLLAWARRVRITTAPLEVSPASLKLRLACLELGWPVKGVVRNEWWRTGSPSEAQMRAEVREQIQRQGEGPLNDWARYCPAETLDRRGLTEMVAEAAEWHHRLVIVDHIHHMDHGDGPENRGIRDTMKLAKKLARQHDLAILFTAQLGRGDVRDRTRKFYPPELTDLQGASGIEQVADGVLLLYQPLIAGTKSGEINQVLTGEREYRSVFKPATMAVKVGKHRLDGETAKNEVVELGFQCGEILDTEHLLHGDAYEKEAVA